MNRKLRRNTKSVNFKQLSIPDVILLTPRTFSDARGWFRETYSVDAFREIGIDCAFVQDNHSLSQHRGTIRGLHFQVPPESQAKLIRVVKGSIFDVAVDLRRASPSYGRWCGATLNAEEGSQVFVPRGFAHGFCTLEPDTEVVYKVDGRYAPHRDAGLVWNDPTLAIDWPIRPSEAVLSDKDANLPRFSGFSSPF